MRLVEGGLAAKRNGFCLLKRNLKAPRSIWNKDVTVMNDGVVLDENFIDKSRDVRCDADDIRPDMGIPRPWLDHVVVPNPPSDKDCRNDHGEGDGNAGGGGERSGHVGSFWVMATSAPRMRT